MSRLISWSPGARYDLRSIIEYINRNNPIAALGVVERIEEAVDRLAQIPIGCRGRMSGTYEMVVTGLPYIVCYRVTASSLEVVRVIHGARNWPAGEWPTE